VRKHDKNVFGKTQERLGSVSGNLTQASGLELLQVHARVYKADIAGQLPFADRQKISNRNAGKAMKLIPVRLMGAMAAALGLCVALAGVSAAQAQEMMTAQTLIDRQMILDQITRYYFNFGRANKAPEISFYTEDAVLILGNTRREGHAGIAQAYGGRPTAPQAGGAAPAPPRERTPFNATVDNALIIVRGDTATSEVIFTEYRTQQVDGKPKLVFTTQGKEFATWAKVKGKWLYKSRQITGDSNPPEGWKE
jgi:hypothetical protein